MTDQIPIDALAHAVLAALRGSRIDLTDEKRAQVDVAALLEGARIPFEREKRLGAAAVLDFFVASRLALEVKMNRSVPSTIYRQVERYCRLDEVRGLLLVTNRAMGLPGTIAGKPAFYLSLGRSWL